MLKKLVIAVIVIGIVFLIFKLFNPVKGGWVEAAKMRVNFVFEGIMEGVSEDDVKYQTAICKWWSGGMIITDMNELDTAVESFGDWRTQGGISYPVSDYKILDAELYEDTDVVTVLVTVEINGREAKLRVPNGLMITWVD